MRIVHRICESGTLKISTHNIQQRRREYEPIFLIYIHKTSRRYGETEFLWQARWQAMYPPSTRAAINGVWSRQTDNPWRIIQQLWDRNVTFGLATLKIPSTRNDRRQINQAEECIITGREKTSDRWFGIYINHQVLYAIMNYIETT